MKSYNGKWRHVLGVALLFACAQAFATNNGNNLQGGDADASVNASNNNINAANSTINDLSSNNNHATGGNGYGGNGGNGYGGQGGDASQGQSQSQGQGQSQTGVVTGINGQHQSATSNSGGNALTNGGNAQSTNVTLNEAEQPDDLRIHQAPTVMLSAPYATVQCYKTGGLSLSTILGGLGLSGGKIDPGCELRETARVVGSFDKDAGIKIACLSELVQMALGAQCAGVPIAQKLTRKQRKSIAVK